MKPIAKSRLFWALLAIVGGYLTIIFRRHLPADLAAALSDELIGAVGVALGLGGVGLRVQDKRRARTAGDLVNAKAARAAGKLGVGMALALLCGCGPTWQLCEVDLNDHPTKPRPAAQATVRCSRTVLCDVATGAVCDGKPLVKEEK